MAVAAIAQQRMLNAKAVHNHKQLARKSKKTSNH